MRCPVCEKKKDTNAFKKDVGDSVQKYGFYRRKSDSRFIQRFYCNHCKNTYSNAIKDSAYNQNKRRVNHPLRFLLGSAVSMRRAAMLLHVSRSTVARKLRFLGDLCRKEHALYLGTLDRSVESIQFDELQTIEHSKCKPLSVATVVSVGNRKILGTVVSSMPATGHLAKISRKKYGYRPDHRRAGLNALFRTIEGSISVRPTVMSDEHPYYRSIVTRYFPKARYCQVKGSKATTTGLGELKKKARDPLFSINHTLAMFRANINRLLRKTWCTTKDPARLADHLAIYISLHNNLLTA